MGQNELKRLQMVQLECPRHWKPTVSFFSGVVRFPFSQYWPSGVIRMGSPVWKWKSWKFIWTKVAQQAANGPVGMPQASKPLILILFWSCENFLQWYAMGKFPFPIFCPRQPRLSVSTIFPHYCKIPHRDSLMAHLQRWHQVKGQVLHGGVHVQERPGQVQEFEVRQRQQLSGIFSQ